MHESGTKCVSLRLNRLEVMKLFKFGYDGYECAEYEIFIHSHNDELIFNNDCKNVLQALTKIELEKEKLYVLKNKEKYPETHICNLPNKYNVSRFFNNKKIRDEMLKLGYEQLEEVRFLPFLDVVKPEDNFEDSNISNNKLKELLGDIIYNEILAYNNNINIEYEIYNKMRNLKLNPLL